MRFIEFKSKPYDSYAATKEYVVVISDVILTHSNRPQYPHDANKYTVCFKGLDVDITKETYERLKRILLDWRA